MMHKEKLMATAEVAQGLVSMCQQGQFMEAIAKYYGDDIVSVEPMGDPAETRGIEAVAAKSQSFGETMEIHTMQVEGPWVNGNQFAARFNLDVTDKSNGKRMQMDEIAVYTVENDKIVHEQFLYGE
jgi:ketosteroid isomerase-like protein